MKEMAFKMLGMLDESKNGVTCEELANSLGVDVSRIKELINILAEKGYTVVCEEGVCHLIERTDLLLPYELKRQLRTRIIGKEIFHFDSIPSTINAAKRLAYDRDPSELHGTIVIAEQQTGGVGRLGRSWASPPGGIWATVFLKPNIPVERLFMITMAGSVAVARAIRREYDIGALIKWPNDIFIGSKKVAGLLQEIDAEGNNVNFVVLGFGIDANIDITSLPEELQPIVTTLQEEVGEKVDRAKLFARVLKEFELRLLQLESGEYDTIIREWKSLSLTLNRRVHVKTLRKAFKGVAIDIDENGALLIRKDNGKVEKVIAGDLFQL
ncbi:MAG: BirA family transcriptional regulator [Candidatus Methanomethylophilaceae archaeon]|nr:MAG: Biotin--acetyl-CoA-carboxylase ligase [Methanomicrobiales archaeon 53_19]MDI3483227.1 BirA family transcriptional regulator [Candidatus Methanomethylophilaceae archaeon]MDI3542367.1 BirA family transcriptional regulator [Candidatus Methanomethylophilaceae archaeon]